MRKFRIFLIFHALFALAPAHAENPQAGHVFTEPVTPYNLAPYIFMLEKIDYLIVGDTHLTSRPWTGNFTALNGTHYFLSELYENNRAVEVNLKTAIEIHKTAKMKISLPVHFDNGYRARLYRAERFLGLGLSFYYTPRANTLFALNMADIVQFGGTVSERPCYDAFRREFHCGTGHAWLDMKNFNHREAPKSLYFRLVHFF